MDSRWCNVGFKCRWFCNGEITQVGCNLTQKYMEFERGNWRVIFLEVSTKKIDIPICSMFYK